nr:hypothetical protein [Micromonospora sp. DSM 115978]
SAPFDDPPYSGSSDAGSSYPGSSNAGSSYSGSPYSSSPYSSSIPYEPSRARDPQPNSSSIFEPPPRDRIRFAVDPAAPAPAPAPIADPAAGRSVDGDALELGDRHTYLDAKAAVPDPDDPLGVAAAFPGRGRHAAPADYDPQPPYPTYTPQPPYSPGAPYLSDPPYPPEPSGEATRDADGPRPGAAPSRPARDYGLSDVAGEPPDDTTQAVAFNGFRR